MALSFSTYASRSRAHASAAGVAPAFAARASSSLNRRGYYERRSFSLVAVGPGGIRTEGGRHRRVLSAVSMSAGWGRSSRQQQPWMVGFGGDAGGGSFLGGGGGGRPTGFGHR